MGQSNVMAGFLALAFVIFITARGKLPAYASIFVGDAGGGESAAPSGTGGTAPSEKYSDKATTPVASFMGVPMFGATIDKSSPLYRGGNALLDFVDGK